VDPQQDEPEGDEYVTFVDARAGLRSSPYTVEGYLGHIGAFSAGAVRIHGWRRFAAKVIVIALLLPIAAEVLHSIWLLLGLLLG
jgi:hypothetical protein